MYKKEFHQFIVTIVGLALHGWLFKVTNFIGSLQLECSDLLKITSVQALNNPINIFFNKSKYYIIFCYVIFIEYLWISKISLVSIEF